MPQASESHGETVCVAALDEYGVWHRLYPINFRGLRADQRFGRWDKIEFDWRLPEVSKDRRAESKRVTPESVKIVGRLKPNEKSSFLERAIVQRTSQEYEAGRSLALVRPQNPVLKWRRRSSSEIDLVAAGYRAINASPDLFGTTDIIPREASPLEFSYEYTDGDGPHVMRCHDWEIEQTFLKWRSLYGEDRGLAEVMRVFGEEYPRKGMVLALGTNSQRNWQWMVIGVIRLDEIAQPSLF